MKLIFDGTVLRQYGFAHPTAEFGGTEKFVRKIITGLAENGHQVHVVAADLEREEQRGDNEWWWGPRNHPTKADVVIAVQNLMPLEEQAIPYVAEHFMLLTTTTDPWLGDGAGQLSRVPCMSQTHVDLLTAQSPSIRPEQCVITGLGVELDDYQRRNRWVGIGPDGYALPDIDSVPGRMFFANDPQRGLWHLLSIFDLVRERVPEATLHIGYDFDRQFEDHRWRSNAIAERLWQCKERIERGDGVVNLGSLTHAELVREQLECQVHCHPSDPPNVGSQTHGLTQMELAAAGSALVLSDIESFPELFSDCAELLPLPGCMAAVDDEIGDLARVRYEDWADVVVGLMQDKDRWQEASTKSRQVAAQHTWPRVLERWETMLAGLE